MVYMKNVIPNEKYIMFRGKPLVRQGNTYCYGSMNDNFVLFIMVLTNIKEKNNEGKEIDVPDRVLIQILSTDNKLPPHERVVKQFDKNGLFEAMDIGLIWLERLNSPIGSE